MRRRAKSISRDLQKLGAVRSHFQGQICYQLPEESGSTFPTPSAALNQMILEINYNASMVILHTTPGSASMVALLLDQHKPAKILGTLAGDDTVFVAASAQIKIKDTVLAIEKLFKLRAE